MNQINNNSLLDFYSPLTAPIGLLSIPHSGLWIPDEFKAFLVSDEYTCNRDVDFEVDKLVDIPRLQQAGVAILVSRVHRVAIDLNRAQDICVLNWKQNSHGQQLVQREPTSEQIQELTLKYYAPYYELLKSTIEYLHTEHAKVSVIDLHSMPSKPTAYHLKINPNQKMQRPDFCVSDISGKSCEKSYIDYTCGQLAKFAGNVTQNDPYFGGNVSRYIDATFPFTNNIQIEINRALYMDEQKIELLKSAQTDFKQNLTEALLAVFQQFNS